MTTKKTQIRRKNWPDFSAKIGPHFGPVVASSPEAGDGPVALSQREALARALAPLALRVARGLGKNFPGLREDLESAAGQALAEVLDPARPSPVAGDQLPGAVVVAARRRCVDVLRAERRRVRPESLGARDVASAGPPAGADLDQVEAFERLTSALSPLGREVLRLRTFEGLPFRAIGLRLGLPEATAVRIASDSRSLLRRQYA